MSALKVPYPPSPTDIPDGLTDYSDSYTRHQNLLLAGLFVFLIFYIAMVVLFAMVGIWCFLTFAKWPVLKVIGMVLCGTFFLYLVKGFFKRPAVDKEMHIEITEEEQPVLFGFIDRLCQELGAPEPNKVFVSPDVNAAVMPRTSLVNLFVEPKKDLLIGLGLVNCVNLSEFKAVLAHEFGHFSQSAMASSYTYIASRIIFDLVEGEDWFDRTIESIKRHSRALGKNDGVGILLGSMGLAFAYSISGFLAVARAPLWWVLKAITLQSRAVAREREFHADLVAVSVAGSDASTQGLLRAKFGNQCFNQAVNDLATALGHKKLYSNNLYLHQDHASVVLRRKKKDPSYGLPPELPHPTAGKGIRVFDADQDDLEDEDDTPPMWRTHPADADREENAKNQFVAAVMDHRSPWILFHDAADLRERMTYKFYRMVFQIPKHADLTDAVAVQEFIDNEHSDTTYDPKYHGAYDDRPLEPGEVSELNSILYESPWTEDRMEKVYERLLDGCQEHAEARTDLLKDRFSLQESVVGRPTSKMKQKIKEVERKLDENWEWFKSFDRRVYLLHVQMAAQVNAEWKDELIERYRFQASVQRLYEESRRHQEQAFLYYKTLFSLAPGDVHPEFLGEVMQVLRDSWRGLKKIVQDAREITLPAMKNFEENENLADFILRGKMVPEPPLSYVKGNWCEKLVDQLGSVRSKCFRLHFKSVGGILALQERVASQWFAARAPVEGEVVDIAVVEAIPAEVVVEPFIDAVPVESEQDHPPLVPGPAPEAIVPPIAAFMAAPTPTPTIVEAVMVGEAVDEVVGEIVDEGVQDPPPLVEPPVVFAFDSAPTLELKTDSPEIPEPSTEIPKFGTEIFSLDSVPEAVASKRSEPANVFTFDTEEDAAPAVVAKPAFGSGTSATMAALSDSKVRGSKVKRRRPARPTLKITVVLPGEPSPFAP